MLKHAAALIAVFLLPAITAQNPPTDFHYRSKTTFINPATQPQSAEHVLNQETFVSGNRTRMEFRGSPNPTSGMVVIQDCSSGMSYMLSLDRNEYTETKLPKHRIGDEVREHTADTRSTNPPATIRIKITYVDTGETSDFFGYTARKYIVSEKRTPVGDASQFVPSETQSESWYVKQLNPHIWCGREEAHPDVSFLVALNGDRPIQPDIQVEGEPPSGLMVKSVSTARDAFTQRFEIVDFSSAPLDPALFAAPKDFKKVREFGRKR